MLTRQRLDVLIVFVRVLPQLVARVACLERTVLAVILEMLALLFGNDSVVAVFAVGQRLASRT